MDERKCVGGIGVEKEKKEEVEKGGRERDRE